MPAYKYNLMKLIRNCTAIILALTVLACNKEKSLELGTNLPGGTNQWEFKESALKFGGTIDTAYLQYLGSLQTLVIEGVSTDTMHGDFFLQIIGAGAPITTTTYSNPN